MCYLNEEKSINKRSITLSLALTPLTVVGQPTSPQGILPYFASSTRFISVSTLAVHVRMATCYMIIKIYFFNYVFKSTSIRERDKTDLLKEKQKTTFHHMVNISSAYYS